jgi:hypothetical protein
VLHAFQNICRLAGEIPQGLLTVEVTSKNQHQHHRGRDQHAEKHHGEKKLPAQLLREGGQRVDHLRRVIPQEVADGLLFLVNLVDQPEGADGRGGQHQQQGKRQLAKRSGRPIAKVLEFETVNDQRADTLSTRRGAVQSP